MKLLIIILSLLFLFVPKQAHAYLDPGVGSLLIQMFIGGVVAAMFTLKMYWYKVKTFILRLLGREISADESLVDNNQSITNDNEKLSD